MLKLVLSYNIKPICVFDGMPLKAKAATEKTRSDNKKANKELALTLAEQGNEDEARKYFTRSLVLRTKMIDLLVDILHALNIECVVAPYEADAQIAYLVKSGQADFAISEDSDLIAYGCPKLIMKLNFQGYCQAFSWEDFKQNEKLKDDKILTEVQQMDRVAFVQACIMGGCEYLPSI
jgi:exonuclease-1